MRRIGKLFASICGVIVIGFACNASADTIDLRNWSQQGTSANGSWTVAGDGSSVSQSINSLPTYYVSDTSFINQEFNGSFTVNTANDDDYIGFVFGWNGIDDYYLFDWKQADQDYSWGQAYEGFTLSHVSGVMASANENANQLWDHTGANVTVLDSSYSSDLGWADYTTYDFTLTYTETGFTIEIDDSQIFAVNGTFSAGQFGFYNFSQSLVTYQGFENEEVPPIDPVPEPATMLLFGAGLAGLAGYRKRQKK